jgi:hypothetical protein
VTTSIGFLIIGAQKGGTTSLFEYVRRHPQVHMPTEKDIAFFNRDGHFQRGWDWYRSTVVRGAPQNAVCGEASTYYMSGTPFGELIANEEQGPPPSLPGGEPLEDVVPQRIREFLPNVKLICVLRDPVARAYSHHRMMVLERAESRSFDEAVSQVMEPGAMERARIAPTRTNNYIVNGEYARVLAGFLRIFPREQLMAIFSDQLAERPAETLAALYEFIGVAPDFVPDNLGTRYRAAAEKERITGFSLDRFQMNLARVRPARALWHALPDGARDRIDRRFKVASYRVGMWNAQRGAAGEDVSLAVRQKLIAHYRPDSEELGDMLGQDIPWLTTWTHL